MLYPGCQVTVHPLTPSGRKKGYPTLEKEVLVGIETCLSTVTSDWAFAGVTTLLKVCYCLLLIYYNNRLYRLRKKLDAFSDERLLYKAFAYNASQA